VGTSPATVTFPGLVGLVPKWSRLPRFGDGLHHRTQGPLLALAAVAVALADHHTNAGVTLYAAIWITTARPTT
jgi:hypothetical protein